MALPEEPIFGAFIGQSIKSNRAAGADREVAQSAIAEANRTASAAMEVANRGAQVSEILRGELDAAIQSELDLAAALGGVRGVARELMFELRQSDPNNPLLDKKVRDRIFDEARDAQVSRMAGDDFPARREKSTFYRDQAYGAPGSNKSGPEKENISKNSKARGEAGVPSHVPDREKFLELIRRLGEELEKANPNASILHEREVKDVFETQTLNEMVRADKPKNLF